MADLKKLIGEHLRVIRKFKHHTQESLADKTGVSFSYISDVERGTRNISLVSLEKIMHALDVSPHEIFHFEEIFENPNAREKEFLIKKMLVDLSQRQLHEVKFIHKVSKEFSDTMDQ
jgi:transcriptional regulator with XRE-family HTH domain